MAQSLEDLYYNFLDAARVNGAKDIGIEVINRYLAMANYDLFNEIWGREKDSIGYATTENSENSLKPLVKNASIAVAGNMATLPTDYFHTIALLNYTGSVFAEIDRITFDELQYRMLNPITKPSSTYPIAIYYPTYIQFYPISTITDVVLFYIKKPTQPIIVLTADATTGVDIYSASSTAPDWSEEHYKDLLRYMVSYLKLGIGDMQSAEYLDAKIKSER